MRWAAIFLFALVPSLAFAAFESYRPTTLDAVIEEWNEITKDYGPGLSLLKPQKIKFAATLQSFPSSCSNAPLAMVFRTLNFGDLLSQVSVTHCFGFSSPKGRKVVAYVQDVLVPGLKSDAKIGGPIEIYADFLAYGVEADRSRNCPIFLVSRFEPL